MKRIGFIIFLLLFSCQNSNNTTTFRNDFNKEELQILQMGRKIIENAYFGSFSSLDNEGFPKIRVVEAFFPDEKWNIYIGTNSRSRKVKEILHNPKTALHYFNKSQLAYLSLYGETYIVKDTLLREKYWKESWQKFYPNKEKDYLLLKFVPKKIEMINISKAYVGDSLTWEPHQVQLRY